MAITIKSIPILKTEAAVRFNNNAKKAVSKKTSVNFAKEISVSEKILAKAKI
ncbi:MAG: hypothetical protein Q8K70_06700 [Bacteroidota bacterium]|nr:hypothetical protein [Bacteroidota bacterium]